MAKRSQTTGQPRKKAKDEQAPESSSFNRLLGNPATREEYETALNAFIRRTTFGILGLIAAVIVVALVYQYLIVPTFAVATVNGEKISVGEFRERIKFEQALVYQQANARYSQVAQFMGENGDPNQFLQQDQQYQQWVRELQLVDILGQRVLDDMINDVLIRQEAEKLNLTVDEVAIEDAVNTYFGYDPTEVAMIGTPETETPVPTVTNTPFVSPTPSNTPLPTSTPTATPEATAEVTAEATGEATAEVMETATLPPVPTQSQEERLTEFEETVDLYRKNIRDTADVSNGAIDALFEREALRQALLESVVTTDTTTMYINARHILVETEEEANEILAALNNGESFATLAQARSTDTGSGQRGGELGWTAAENFVGEFQTAALEAPIGAIVGPIETEFGFHIIQVSGREERDIEGTERDQLRQAEFAQWVEALREANEPNITINDNWVNFIPAS
jgi:peptidyl-prolyl cis-trans isomerase D